MTSLIGQYNHLAILRNNGSVSRGAHWPQMMDSKQIFALDVDYMFWNDDGSMVLKIRTHHLAGWQMMPFEKESRLYWRQIM